MRATYKLGRNVITEFESQNIGNSISGVQISKIFRERGGGNARFWNMSHGQGMRLDPRLVYELVKRFFLRNLKVKTFEESLCWAGLGGVLNFHFDFASRELLLSSL